MALVLPYLYIVTPKKRFLRELEKTNFKTYGYTVNKPLLVVVVISSLLRH